MGDDQRTAARSARPTLLGLSAVSVVVALVASPAAVRAAAGQTWPPFVLVAGLLMVGAVAHADGLFAALGAGAARAGGRPAVLLVALLVVVAAVTAVLNLDTAVAFLTPVLVLAARARGLDEEPFLYGALLMSNAASLLLPGSNLTNLLVLRQDRMTGTAFAARMLPAWGAAVVVTALFTVVAHRRSLGGRLEGRLPQGDAPLRLGAGAGAGAGALGVALAAVLLLVLPSPALPVLVLGVVLALRAICRGSISASAIRDAVDPATLAGVFALAVTLGAVARDWSGPAHLVASAGRTETAVLGALAAVALNNLPAAALLASRPPAQPTALLLGLNLGPNLAVTGSLSALIWYRAAVAVGARPSVWRVTRLGVVLVPLSIAAAELALWAFGR